jgi:hypothetical protein
MGKVLTHLPAIVFGIATGILLATRPDIEKYLNEHVPGSHMPDAFNDLNETSPYLMLFATTTLMLAGRLVRQGQYVLFLPLLFGPLICIAGWLVTENFRDPNWFHLSALMTIGMFVSSVVTFVLVIANPKTTEPRDERMPE